MNDLYHPEYTSDSSQWTRWRDAYEGGRDFVNRYLRKLSSRENDDDFKDRKEISYCPCFAASAIDDVKNSIFQRVSDVTRIGGPESYQMAVNGELGGVDYTHNTMGSFIGSEVLAELLVMGKVGALVDNHSEEDLGQTELDKGDLHPFLTVFKRENIISWAPSKTRKKKLDRILLKENYTVRNDLGLPFEVKTRFRYMEKTKEGVKVILYESKPDEKDALHIDLDIPDIPFTVFNIKQSLMKNIADYQVSLLNIESSDISFVQKANFPFFYEFFDPESESVYLKTIIDGVRQGLQEEQISANIEKKVGSTVGMRYPNKTKDKPGYVNPDPETLIASMKKSDQIKKDIRALLHLNLATLDPRRQSAESKETDDRSLEAGLSAIGLELQRGEQEIASIWADFENSKPAKVTYPKTYDLQTDEDKRKAARELNELCETVPSNTFRRETKKMIIERVHSSRVSRVQLDKMKKEVDESKVVTSNPNILLSAHKAGLTSDLVTVEGLGVGDADTLEQAKKDRAAKIALAMAAQGGMDNASPERGAPEFDKGIETESEKENKPKRGKQNNTVLG